MRVPDERDRAGRAVSSTRRPADGALPAGNRGAAFRDSYVLPAISTGSRLHVNDSFAMRRDPPRDNSARNGCAGFVW
jgi:hypothetical protein